MTKKPTAALDLVAFIGADRRFAAAIEEASGLLGCQEIADLLDVKVETVHHWRHRDRQARKNGLDPYFPPPALIISGVPIWTGRSILSWCYRTSRLDRVRITSRHLTASGRSYLNAFRP